MKAKTSKVLHDLGTFNQKTRALRNQPLFDGGNIAPFITQPRPDGSSCD